MANIKNFGLIGVGSNVQYGKAGPRLQAVAGAFKFRDAANASSVDVELGKLTASGLTLLAGSSTDFGANVLTNIANGVELTDAVSLGQMETALAGKLDLTGGVLSGNLGFGGQYQITGLAAPTDAGHAATKSYVDSVANGLAWKTPVALALVDHEVGSEALVEGDRVANLTTGVIYTVTAEGFDAGTQLVDGEAFFDKATETGYVYSGSEVVQFTGAGQIDAGLGLSKDGNIININLGAGIAQLPTDEVGIDLRADSGLFLTVDGLTDSIDSAAQLAIKLDGSTLALTSAGIKISDDVIARITALEGTSSSDSEVSNIETAVGLNTDGTLQPWATTGKLAADDTFKAAIEKLDAALVATDIEVTANAEAIANIGIAEVDSGLTFTDGKFAVDTDVIATKQFVTDAAAAATVIQGANAASVAFDNAKAKTAFPVKGFVHRIKVYVTTAASTDSAITVGEDDADAGFVAVDSIATADDVDSSQAGLYILEVNNFYAVDTVLAVYATDGAVGRMVVEYIKDAV